MKKSFCEFIGTYILVFCGTGSIIINEISHGVVTHFGIAFTFGLIVLSLIYTLGDISGAHMNPAVSFAFWCRRELKTSVFLTFIASQFAGALAASFTLKILFPQSLLLGNTLPAGSDIQSFILETILTFILMLVICQVSTAAKETGIMAGIAIGSLIAVEALFAGPISGASMNPARSLAPALVSGNFQSIWIYLTAPFIGAFLGSGASVILRRKEN